MEEATVTISVKEHEALKKDRAMLQALEAAGVDNWDGYSEAYNAAFPYSEED